MPDVDRQRHAERSRLFLAATRLAADQREAFVHSTASDHVLAREVLDLLEHDRPDAAMRATRGLQAGGPPVANASAGDPSRIATSAGATRQPADAPVGPGLMGTVRAWTLEAFGTPLGPGRKGRHVGEYELLDVLGRGGSGVVYRARQPRLDREVALKLLPAGALDGTGARRLEVEARVLAMLDHPGIARLLDSGVHPDPEGPRPYLVMERVHGLPITDWCAARELGPAARVDILQRVCEATHHAHQQGVLHRDLKPQNVLVDERGQPRVLDFGLARPLGGASGVTLLDDQAGQLLGTLGYMAPEVFAHGIERADVRADVYALGVMAHELLAGRPPFDLAGHSMAEVGAVLSHQRAPLLGTLDRRLRGDLEAVVARALEPDPARRHGSVEDLRRDLAAWRAGERVSARRPGALEALMRGARRHALACTAGLAVLTSLAVGVVTQRSARLALEAELDRSWSFTSLLQALLGTPPAGSRGDPTMREVLDAAAATLVGRSDLATGVQGDAHDFLGRIHMGLARDQEGKRRGMVDLRRAAELSEEADGWKDERTPRRWIYLAAAVGSTGTSEEQAAVLDHIGAHAESLRRWPELRASWLATQAQRARQAGRRAEALALYEEAYALTTARREGAPGGYQILMAMVDLLPASRAEALLVERLSWSDTAPSAPPMNARQRFRLAVALAGVRCRRAREQWSGSALRDALSAQERVFVGQLDAVFERFGPTAEMVLRLAVDVAGLQLELGRVDEALDTIERFVDAARESHGAEHVLVLRLENLRCIGLAWHGDGCEARAAAPALLERWSAANVTWRIWPDELRLILAHEALAAARPELAAPLVAGLLATWEARPPYPGYDLVPLVVNLAACLDGQAAVGDATALISAPAPVPWGPR